MRNTLHLTREQASRIIDHAQRNAPQEACGLIAGHGGHARHIYPLRNASDRPGQQFHAAPDELLQALKHIDATGQEWIGVYHSHPHSDPLPSERDIRQAERHTPQQIQLIISLSQAQPRLQAWHIRPAQVQRVELVIGRATTTSERGLWPAHTPARRIAVITAAIIAVVVLVVTAISLLPPAPSLS